MVCESASLLSQVFDPEAQGIREPNAGAQIFRFAKLAFGDDLVRLDLTEGQFKTPFVVKAEHGLAVGCGNAVAPLLRSAKTDEVGFLCHGDSVDEDRRRHDPAGSNERPRVWVSGLRLLKA